MRAFRELERVEDRVLGALRLVDAGTGAPIQRRLRVEAVSPPSPRLVHNPSGLVVVASWPPLATHREHFDAPPAEPAPGSLSLDLAITDPDGQYMPRRCRMALPRDPDPDAPDSLLRALDVPMYPAPAAALGTNWSALRVSLAGAGGEALGGALLRVRRNGEVLARGLTDWRGEGLVAVVGVPVTTFSEGDDVVVVSEIEVTLEAVFDPASGTRTPAARVRAGHAPEVPPSVDPAAIEAAMDALPRASAVLSIAARRQARCPLTLDLP